MYPRPSWGLACGHQVHASKGEKTPHLMCLRYVTLNPLLGKGRKNMRSLHAPLAETALGIHAM